MYMCIYRYIYACMYNKNVSYILYHIKIYNENV